MEKCCLQEMKAQKANPFFTKGQTNKDEVVIVLNSWGGGGGWFLNERP
jgi:hypothetical protein